MACGPGGSDDPTFGVTNPATGGSSGATSANSGSGGAGNASMPGADAGAGASGPSGGTASGGFAGAAVGGLGGFAGAATSTCGSTSKCGPKICGNGVRDSCEVCTYKCAYLFEECDGPDLGPYTCESLGWAGGVVTCATDCYFDQSGCNSCAGGLPTCGPASFVAAWNVKTVSVASNGVDASIVWIDQDGGHFAKLDAALQGHGFAGPFGATKAEEAALAPLASGDSLVALATLDTTTLFRVSDGIATLLFTVSGRHPLLASRDEGPLLAYMAADGKWTTEVLGPTGEQSGAAHTTFANHSPEGGSATFDGSRFFLTAEAKDGATVVPIETDGSPGTPSVLGTSKSWYPRIAADAGAVRMTFLLSPGQSTALQLVALDANAAPVSPYTALGDSDFPAPIEQRGEKSMVLVKTQGYTDATVNGVIAEKLHLAVVVNGSSQATLVARAPWLSSYGMARRQGDVVITWLAKSHCGTKLWLASAKQ